MDKEVLVSISGLQFSEANKEAVEMITVADYYKKNDKHYLIFDEAMEGFEGTTRNMIKFNEHMVDITKKGITNVHMVFEEKQKNMTYYDTPFGNLLIGLSTNRIDVEEETAAINVKIDYSLDINYEFVSDCKISISVKEKKAGDISLFS
ncbi:MAG: DUF1934 domain-containing protein [Lachnospiraceae bacterium]|nr:DUF1934 domain-containing protein [Lachnospiraceae bacterium]